METTMEQTKAASIKSTDVFRALLNPSKQLIVEYLSHVKYGSATSFIRKLRMKQSTVSKSLKGLVACKILNKEKIGSVTLYYLNKDGIIQIITEVLNAQLFCPYEPKSLDL